MRPLGIRLLFAGVFCAMAVSACGDDDGGGVDGGGVDGGGVDGGSADGGSADGGAGSGSACLQGSWDCTLPDSSTAEMTISGTSISGSFTRASVTGTVASTFIVDGDTFTVTDTGGTGACPPSQTGTYTFSCATSSLSFAEVDDECVGRSNFFSCDWTKR